MRSSIQLGRIFGIPIGINYSWIVIFLLVTTSLSGYYFPSVHPEWSPALLWAVGAATSVLFFASVLVHELAHSAVSIAQGIPVQSITLFIFGGVASIAAEPKRARDEFFMALAGPLASLGLALFFWLVTLLTARVLVPLSSLSSWLAWINLSLAVFNLIPGFPLDGGRVFRAIVWWITGNLTSATRIATILGRVVAYMFVILGVLAVFRGDIDGLWLAFIGWFLDSAAIQSLRQVELREALRGVKAGDIMTQECAYVPEQLTVDLFVHNYLLPQSRRCFLLTDRGRLTGMVTMHRIKEVPRDKWEETHVGAIMTPFDSVKHVQVTDDALSVLELMDHEDVNQVPVMDGENLVGLISRDNVVHFIHTRTELGA